MTNATAGVGTEFQLGDGGSPESFTKVAEVLSISGPELSGELIDVSSLDTTGGYKEFISGMRDGGSVSIEFNWVSSNANQQSLRDRISDINNANSFNYRIVWSNSPATQVDFVGVVESFSMNTEANSAITGSISIKVSGQPTWTN